MEIYILNLLKRAFKEAFAEMREEEVKTSVENNPEEWLNKEQVKNLLGVCSTTIWQWEKQGYLIPQRFGRKARYLKSDVERVIKAEGKNIVEPINNFNYGN